MLRRCLRISAFVALPLVAACASPPPPPPPVVPFETKMAWIIRLEDQRMLRDPAAPIPPPPAKSGRRTVVVEPPPPPDLLRLLTDDEARIRRRSALAAGRVGLPEAVPALVRLLQTDGDPEVRQMAAFALGLIGDASAAEPLRAALVDPLPLIAGRAAEALGLIGDAASAPAIAKMVAAHAAAAAAVAPDEARPHLEGAADAFRLGVYALARLKSYDGLAASVLGPDGLPRVRWWPVAYALQRIEDMRAAPALIALAGSDSAYTKAFAIKGLGQLRDASAMPLLLPLIDPARTATTATIEAIRAAGRIGDDRATAPLLKLLYARDLSPMVRAETLLALAKTGGEVSSDAFVDFLGDRSPSVRLAALQALAERDEDAFLLVLSGIDPDPHYSVRAGLASILATKDPERSLPRLTPMLADTDARVVPAVLTAMAKLKAPDIGAVLVDHLAKEDVGIRAAATTALGEIKPEGGVDALIAAYKRGEADLVADTRAAAIEALSKYGSAASVATLKAALADKDWAVRVKAAELLKPLDPSIDTAQAIRPAPAANAIDYTSPTLVNPSVSPQVYIETEKGTIQIELDVLDAPLTAQNFVTLARRGYFDGLSFHRVVANFVVQGGDPRGDGEGGPGYSIRDELNQEPYVRGTVGMALAWRDTGGSQFFITHSPQPHLDARYTVFGRVIAGIEVVDLLTQWDTITRIRVWDGKQ